MIPIKVAGTYRPHRFVCSNSRVFTRVYLYRYTPAQGWDDPPAGYWPGQWLAYCTPHRDSVRSLPTGMYTFCVEYWHPNDEWQCYIKPDSEGVVPNDPMDTLIATPSIFYDALPDHPARCSEDMMACWGSTDPLMPPGIGPWQPGTQPTQTTQTTQTTGGAGQLPAVSATPVTGAVAATGGFPINAAYDTASFQIDIDPGQVAWMAFSGIDQLGDRGTGPRAEGEPDGILDILWTNIDDYLIVEVSKDGASSGAIVLNENDGSGRAIGNQAVIYGHYPSVWHVQSVDWSVEPAAGYYATAPETGELTQFIDDNGEGTYRFELTFMNVHTDRASHEVLQLLVGAADG
jgi:hypothetical protein